jgi:hypothetical protein
LDVNPDNSSLTNEKQKNCWEDCDDKVTFAIRVLPTKTINKQGSRKGEG